MRNLRSDGDARKREREELSSQKWPYLLCYVLFSWSVLDSWNPVTEIQKRKNLMITIVSE